MRVRPRDSLRRRVFRCHGLTLIEILVTIAVLGILFGIAVPTWTILIPAYQLNSATRQVATELQLARNRAMAQYRRYRLIFSSPTTYRIEKETAPQANAYELFSGPKNLPGGVSVSANVTPTFLSRGNASQGGTITLAHSAGPSKAITLLPSGRIEIK
jgi:prepilin-type N-terminal cleavage/methylation domain-containing protein